MMSSLSSNVRKHQQVFINFRGAQLRKTFVSHLESAFEKHGINFYIDTKEPAGEDLHKIFERIEESTVAVAILSSGYTESNWCINELVKIMERVDQDNLWVIPIFYNLDRDKVKHLDGNFGVQLWDLWRKERSNRDDRIIKWNAALQRLVNKFGLVSETSSNETEFLDKVIIQVMNLLSKRRGEAKPKPEEGSNRAANRTKALNQIKNSIIPGGQRQKTLEEKLDVECNDKETRIVGVVGMPGIGKTYLARQLFEKLKRKFSSHVFIQFDSEKSEEQGLKWVRTKLVEGLLEKDCSDLRSNDGNALEVWKDSLIEKKAMIVFDNVSDQKQIETLQGRSMWIKNGSKIVITTREKSLLELLACDLYEVPGLNERDGLELFSDTICTTLVGKFKQLSREIVDYSGGNPLALKAFGDELKGKSEAEWEARVGTLTQGSNMEIRDFLRKIYENDLTEKQKDAFLDIVCFFRSQDEDYVKYLVDSFDRESGEGGTEVRELVDKFFIHISNDRIEIQNLFFTMGKELIDTNGGESKLFSSIKERKHEVRGIVLDMSKMEEMPLDCNKFLGMSNLRYLKVYNSIDSGNGEAQCNLNLPDQLKFPEDNIVRYFYWMKFPKNELPSNFKPKNLIDLSLPYSDITCIWSNVEVQVAPKLKWVDLSHSSKLESLSGFPKAPNLLRLNLEGCISLEKLPEEMKDMKSLVSLNLKNCRKLSYLPKIEMECLKVLILSGCKKLKKFQVISKTLETLYLNDTAIDELPSTINILQRLILLNLKDCKNLVALPCCLWELDSLQELKLSRCSNLNSFPDGEGSMKNLRILLLDETSIKEMPHANKVPFLSFLQRLCLSGNNVIRNLQINTSHLKWLELKHCKNLISLQLPPNLQCLDAHGCILLKTVSSPPVIQLPTDQLSTENIHSTLIFTNCNKLEQVSKNVIISYVQKKSQVMSDDRYNRDFVFNSLTGTCFPGDEVPVWFNHQSFGSNLKLNLPREWNEGRLNGVALCVVVSFKEYKDQTNNLQVKCTCEFSDHTNINLRRVSFIVGGWSETGDGEPHKIASEHVFIGYTSWFNTRKRQEEEHKNEYVPTEVSLSFEVTDSTTEVLECEVLKCGFSLVYESEKAENVSQDASFGATPEYGSSESIELINEE